MKKQLICIAMVVQLFLSFVLPVKALAINDAMVSEMEERCAFINELITLAGKAARDGDYDKAEAYEAELMALGVEIVVADTYENACAAFEMLDEDVAIMATIDKPVDTSSVHWYRMEYPRYFYPQKGKAFDAITLRAVSWDDTSNWLHLDKWSHSDPSTYENTGFIAVATAMTQYAFKAFVDFGASATGTIMCYTILDVLSEAIGAVDSGVIEVAMESYLCHYVADVSYIFTYVKETDTNDPYVLSGVEAIVDAQYQIHFTGKTKYADGHVDSYPQSTVSYSRTTISNEKIDIFKSFDAYEQGRQYIGEIGAIYVELDGRNYYIAYINMPESPATPFSLSNEETVE